MQWNLFIVLFLAALAMPVAGAAELSAQETQAARKLSNTKCLKCHRFYDPAASDETEWDGWMRKMGRKSRLKPDQYELLSRYLATLRTRAKEAEKN
jgi:hypothetical protein